MNIEDVMTRMPQFVSTDDTLYHAMRLMQFGGFSHLPVYDGHHLVGMLRWPDIERFLAQAPDPADWLRAPSLARAPRVREAVRYRLATVAEHAALADAVRRMLAEEEDCLLVLDDGGQLAGIFTRSDALRVLLAGGTQAVIPPHPTSPGSPELSA